jgi:hypothetical protein
LFYKYAGAYMPFGNSRNTVTIQTPPVPEFSTIALFAILVLVMGGFVVMRRNET